MINVTMLVLNGVYGDSRVLKEAESLSRNGCLVTIVGMTDKHPHPSFVTPFKIILIRVTSRHLKSRYLIPIKFIELVYRNYKYLVKQDIDVIHCHDIGPMLIAWIVAWKKNIPIIYDSHELEYDRDSTSRWIRYANRVYEKIFIGKSSQIIVSDGDFRANVMRRVHNIMAPITYVRNCPPKTYNEKKNKVELRGMLGLPHDTRIIIYIGHVAKGRATRETLEALSHLPTDVSMVVIGTIRERQVFDETIDKYKLHGRVHVIDPVPYSEVVNYASSADVGLCLYENNCLSNYHSTPTKLFDYISAAVPLLVSNFPAMNDIVKNSPHGIIGASVDPSDPETIAKGVMEILNWDSHFLSVVKERMKELHFAKYNWDIQEKALFSVYDSVGIQLSSSNRK